MKKMLALCSLGLLLIAVSAAFAADGAALYKETCAGCHGADGSKSTGGSTPVKDLDAPTLLKRLQGYADGSYGGAQKKVMENIVKKHSAEDLKTLADYMGTL